MPLESEQQRKLMWGIKSGSIKPRRGLPSKAVAEEFTSKDQGGRLPKKVKARAKKRA
jgi:hypothetical protein